MSGGESGAELGNAGLSRARSLYERAVDAYSRGRASGALRSFARAAALIATNDHSREATALRGRIWLSTAACEAEVCSLEASFASLDRAEAAANAADDEELAILVSAQRGSILLRVGRLGESAAALDVALGRLHHVEPRDRAVLQLNRGTVAMFQGDLRRAQTHLQRAIEASGGAEFVVQRLQATHNLAYVRFLLGDLPSALRGMDEAAAIIPDLDSGIIMLDEARVLFEAGLVQRADATLARAGAIFRGERLTQDLGEVELERARCALVAGDVDGARRLAMRARDRFRRRGNDRWRRSAELVLLQGDLAAGRPGSRLSGPAERLRAEFDQDGNRIAARTAALIAAEAHLLAGNTAAAAQSLATSGRSSRGDPITARLHAHYVAARLDAARHRPTAASRRARRALDELADYQASFGSIDLATAAAVHGRRLADLDLSLALRTGRPEIVLESAERSRAVSARLPVVRPPDDPTAAALFAELRQTIETLRPVEDDRRRSAPLLARRAELEAEIAARGWSRSGGGLARPRVGLDELRAALTGTTLVSFSRSAAHLHAVTVSAAGLDLVALGRADQVDEQVRRVRADLDVLAQPRLAGPLRGAVRASLERSLALLDAAVVAPLALRGRVVVVATGTLGQLPWGLVPSLRGVPVVVAPSASAWHAAQVSPRVRRRRVLTVAGPGLARGAEEAAQIAGIWHGTPLEAATGAQFTRALAGSRILHVAAHGVHQTENPLFSSVRLSDGPLFAHELDQSVGTPEHVVLSSCELGLATIRPGDEALGLTSVLLHLGTRCVVAGVARVGDEIAATTMADYHSRLRAGSDAALALAEALAGARDNGADVPFVCFGATFSATTSGRPG